MFEVGEIVFCPMRGSGIVEVIERRTMLNESKEYVVIKMKDPNLTMMVPTERIQKSGFRKVTGEAEAGQAETILAKKEIEISHDTDIKVRTKKNQEKLQEGSFVSCSEVVRDLSCMERVKALNNVERTLLMQAKKLLLDEFSIIKHISVEEAESIVHKLLEE
ncbi:MAG: CarD family transcriptional regulator [Cellulosilyticaceae bacterium]